MRSQSRHSPADGADEAFGERVRLRRSYRRLHDPDAFAVEDGVEAAREFGIAIADQEPEARRLLLKCPGELTGSLRDPGARRVGGAAGEMDATASELDEEQDIEASQRDRLDGEEVNGEHGVGLLAQEHPPREAGTLASRTEPGLAEDIADGRRRNGQAESVDLAGDPLIAPAWVLARKPEHELSDLAANRRPPNPTRVRPAASNEPAVPATQRRRGHQERTPA
jgi:hypothetical protein